MIFPAIDLMDGGCVRLYKGDFKQRTNYTTAPIDVACQYKAQGAEWLHVVDLDGAKSANSGQADLIIEIAQASGLRVQSGGGLRDLSQIQRLLNGGVERVVLGSLALSNPQMVKFWLRELGPDVFVIALDVRVGKDNVPYPTSNGWTETGKMNLWQILDDYAETGLKTILVTDIDRDGVLAGANVSLYQDIMERFPEMGLITSGGVGSLDDVKALKALKPEGIIIGKALYENKFTLEQAISC